MASQVALSRSGRNRPIAASACAAKLILEIDGARVEDVFLQVHVVMHSPACLIHLGEDLIRAIVPDQQAKLAHCAELLPKPLVLRELAESALTESRIRRYGGWPAAHRQQGEKIALFMRHMDDDHRRERREE